MRRSLQHSNHHAAQRFDSRDYLRRFFNAKQPASAPCGFEGRHRDAWTFYAPTCNSR